MLARDVTGWGSTLFHITKIKLCGRNYIYSISENINKMKFTLFRDLTSCRLVDRCKCCGATKRIYEILETWEDKRNMFQEV